MDLPHNPGMCPNWDRTCDLLRLSFHCSKQFLSSLILMPFSASCHFLFHLFHMGKMFPFEDFFHRGNKKSCLGWDHVNREGGAQWTCRFGQKMLNIQHGVGRCPCKSPIMKWANTLSLQKNSECSLSQQRQLVHWYRWVPRTLTRWGKPVLQGACLPEDNFWFFGGPPHTLSKFQLYNSYQL